MAVSEMSGIAGPSRPKVNAARKSFRMLSKVGTPKWVSNNRSLAKENAKYRKEIQKLTRMVSEQSIRYRSLEMSWLHRGVNEEKEHYEMKMSSGYSDGNYEVEDDFAATSNKELSDPLDLSDEDQPD